jgi:hypothetical protein
MAEAVLSLPVLAGVTLGVSEVLSILSPHVRLIAVLTLAVFALSLFRRPLLIWLPVALFAGWTQWHALTLHHPAGVTASDTALPLDGLTGDGRVAGRPEHPLPALPHR